MNGGIRINFVVEGHTEEMFVKKVLQTEFYKMNISTYPRLVANRKDSRRKFKGGLLSYGKAKKDIINWLNEDKKSGAWFTTMFDYYALPKDFPGYDKLRPGMNQYEKVVFLEEEFKKDIGHERFIPYIQLHEFEALLFVEPAQLAGCYFDDEDKTAELCSILEAFQGNPELINAGQNTAPSKRIIALYPKYKNDKPIVGCLVSEATGIPKLRRFCKHFNDWVTKLEGLSKTT